MDRISDTVFCTLAFILIVGVSALFTVGIMAAAKHDAAVQRHAAATRTAHQSAIAACLRDSDDYSQFGIRHCEMTAN